VPHDSKSVRKKVSSLIFFYFLRREGLFGAQQIQKFYRDVDETVGWILEKDSTLSTDDYGRDLNNVQALQRKHEGTERDLAALESKVLILV
jgi:spectrin alpha